MCFTNTQRKGSGQLTVVLGADQGALRGPKPTPTPPPPCCNPGRSKQHKQQAHEPATKLPAADPEGHTNAIKPEMNQKRNEIAQTERIVLKMNKPITGPGQHPRYYTTTKQWTSNIPIFRATSRPATETRNIKMPQQHLKHSGLLGCAWGFVYIALSIIMRCGLLEASGPNAPTRNKKMLDRRSQAPLLTRFGCAHVVGIQTSSTPKAPPYVCSSPGPFSTAIPPQLAPTPRTTPPEVTTDFATPTYAWQILTISPASPCSALITRTARLQSQLGEGGQDCGTGTHYQSP